MSHYQENERKMKDDAAYMKALQVLQKAEKAHSLATKLLWTAEKQLKEVLLRAVTPETQYWETVAYFWTAAATLDARLEAKTRKEETHARLTDLLKFRFQVIADRDTEAPVRLVESERRLRAARALGDVSCVRYWEAIVLMEEAAVRREEAAVIKNETDADLSEKRKVWEMERSKFWDREMSIFAGQ